MSFRIILLLVFACPVATRPSQFVTVDEWPAFPDDVSWCQTSRGSCSGQQHSWKIVKTWLPYSNTPMDYAHVRFADWDGDKDTDVILLEIEGTIVWFERLPSGSFNRHELGQVTAGASDSSGNRGILCQQCSILFCNSPPIVSNSVSRTDHVFLYSFFNHSEFHD